MKKTETQGAASNLFAGPLEYYNTDSTSQLAGSPKHYRHTRRAEGCRVGWLVGLLASWLVGWLVG